MTVSRLERLARIGAALRHLTVCGTLAALVGAWSASQIACQAEPRLPGQSDDTSNSNDDENGGSSDDNLADDLLNRAYIVNKLSDELTVIDLRDFTIVGQVRTRGLMNHMAELSRDFKKVYVDSSDSDEAVVVDATRLEISHRITVGKHPTHLTAFPNDDRLAIMLEGDNAVAIVDSQSDQVIRTIPGFSTPHFMRFSKDGKRAYVANIGGYHITTIDVETLEPTGTIVLDGHSDTELSPDEGGFADAQIDRDGILYAAHAETGKVLVYDTNRQVKISELGVGNRPWVVFAEHPYPNLLSRYLVPTFGDRQVSVIGKNQGVDAVLGTLSGDDEAYGVNVSPLAPGMAFVMNRARHDVAVVDLQTMAITSRLAVGGNTETASTTADGRYIVATVSSANRVVIIDVASQSIVKTFENVGQYPWSVTIPLGQNYCH